MSFSLNQGGRSFSSPMSEINVTPFVDVMLVLLVIFMVTAPMMVQGLDIKLPDTKATELDSADEKLVLEIKKNQKIYIGTTEISIDKLADILKTNAKIKKDKEILLRADRSLPYGLVVKVMAMAKAGGAESIGMVTEPSDEIS